MSSDSNLSPFLSPCEVWGFTCFSCLFLENRRLDLQSLTISVLYRRAMLPSGRALMMAWCWAENRFKRARTAGQTQIKLEGAVCQQVRYYRMLPRKSRKAAVTHEHCPKKCKIKLVLSNFKEKYVNRYRSFFLSNKLRSPSM